jgi:hypothetical protein
MELQFSELNSLKHKAHLSNTYKFSPCRKENTTRLHDNDELVNAA